MYRGQVAEAGDVEPVVKDPRHPYTRLLIQSIPKADPDQPWTHGELPPDPARPVVTASESCRFVNRCPYAMEICRTASPPLFRTDEHRAVTCFLYQESPKLESAQLDLVLQEPKAQPVLTGD
jgi:peptide/nickel transport system ATP-binding protein